MVVTKGVIKEVPKAVVAMTPVDQPTIHPILTVSEQTLKDAGFNLDSQAPTLRELSAVGKNVRTSMITNQQAPFPQG